MSRPLTRAQALENRAFLSALSRTANIRLACREVGLKYGTVQHRRRVHRAFGVRVEAALVAARARLMKKSGRAPALTLPRADARGAAARRHAPSMPERLLPLPQAVEGRSFRTSGGEAVLVRLKDGGLQVRRAQPGKLTPAAEQAFLSALSATCNVSLAAAAVGSCCRAFRRRRKKDPGFAREMRLAVQRGYLQLELALLESHAAASHDYDDWRNNSPPAMPPMTPSQALQLMYLHQKEARLIAEPDWIKRRPRESREAHSLRLSAMYEERLRLQREAFEVAEALRWERGEPAWGPAGEAVRARLGLPDLAQVTGWSRADPAKTPHDPARALFGGWRIEQMEEKLSRE